MKLLHDPSQAVAEYGKKTERPSNRSTTLWFENPWPATIYRPLGERLCDGFAQMEKEDHFDLPDRADNE